MLAAKGATMPDGPGAQNPGAREPGASRTAHLRIPVHTARLNRHLSP